MVRLLPPPGHVFRWAALRRGEVPCSLAPYRPLPRVVADALPAVLGLGDADCFADLGSGDGRVVAAAARTGVALAVGVEADPRLAALSRRLLASEFPALVASRRIRILQEPLGWTPLVGVTAVFVNLLPFVAVDVVPWLRRHARGAVRLATMQRDFFRHAALEVPVPVRVARVDVYVRVL